MDVSEQWSKQVSTGPLPTGETAVTPADVDAALAVVEDGSVVSAMHLVRAFLQRGVSPDDLIGQLMVPVQASVGECWEVDTWSVAQEHAATAVVETMLSMVAARADTTGWRGRVVVACVEDERHSLPSRMMNERLRLRGWETVFLGASTPADHLRSFLEGGDFVALVASAQTPLSLFGAGRTIRAAHRAGTPVVIGGRALGGDDRRARSLGADAWCELVDELDEVLEGWVEAPPTTFAEPISDEAEHLVLLASSGEFVDRMADRIHARWPELATTDEIGKRHGRQDLQFIVEFLAAAVLSADHRLMSDFLDWLGRVLHHRGVPDPLLATAFEVLRQQVPRDLHRTHAILGVVGPMLQPI